MNLKLNQLVKFRWVCGHNEDPREIVGIITVKYDKQVELYVIIDNNKNHFVGKNHIFKFVSEYDWEISPQVEVLS